MILTKARPEWVGTIDPSGGQHLFGAITRAGLGSPAERAGLGVGKYYPPANSKTKGRRNARKAAIESS